MVCNSPILNCMISKNVILGFIFSLFVVVSIAQEQQKINPDGFNTFYYPGGVKSSEGNLKNGKPDGYWKSYYESGRLKSEETV